MDAGNSIDHETLSQFRLFLEEHCADLCRFQHVKYDDLQPQQVNVAREVCLGIPDTFADIRVQPPGKVSYFVEIDIGYPLSEILQRLGRKYGPGNHGLDDGSKVVVVLDRLERPRAEVETEIRKVLHPSITLELWEPEELIRRTNDCFNVKLERIEPGNVMQVRTTLDQAKWEYAFGTNSANTELLPSLLWRFGHWRLKSFNERLGVGPQDVLPPANYKNVIVLLADLSSYSSFVRDTRDHAVVRHALTTFYSNARYAAITCDGMLLQFVGDEIVALFNIPHESSHAPQSALKCAELLLDIGKSVANGWQRKIDRVQKTSGVHVAIGVGDLDVVHERPLARANMAAVGDVINLTARMLSHAAANEVIVSNTLYHQFDAGTQSRFQEQAPIEARNVGMIKAWLMSNS